MDVKSLAAMGFAVMCDDGKIMVPREEFDEYDYENESDESDESDDDELDYDYYEDPDYHGFFKNQIQILQWLQAPYINDGNVQYCALPERILLERHGKQITGFAENCDSADQKMCNNQNCDRCNYMEKLLLDLVYEANDRFELEPFYDPEYPAGCDLPTDKIPSYHELEMHDNCDSSDYGSEYKMCTMEDCQRCNAIADYLAENAQKQSRKRMESPCSDEERSSPKRNRSRRVCK